MSLNYLKMKKLSLFIFLLAVLNATAGNEPTINLHLAKKSRNTTEDRNAYRVAGLIGGGAFILMGCVTPVNEVWVPTPGTSNPSQYGSWKKQKWSQDPSKWAPIVSGVFIIGISFAIGR